MKHDIQVFYMVQTIVTTQRWLSASVTLEVCGLGMS